tara:strand:+ start:75 stop:263 length:189 start_codon:yes stop_codon:yes gene_type:complete
MSEHVKNFIDKLASGNNADAGEAFKDALRAKVADGLDKRELILQVKYLMEQKLKLLATLNLL